MSVHAVVLVPSSLGLNWLGPRRAIDWVFRRLEDVRGLTDYSCVVADTVNLPERFSYKDMTVPVYRAAAELLAGDANKHADLDRWLTSLEPVRTADCLVVVNTHYPLLDARRIENCLDSVFRSVAEVAFTARTATAIAMTGVNPDALYVLAGGCRAFAPSRTDKYPHAAGTACIVHTVPISAPEDLNLANVDDFTAIKALIADGEVC